MPSLNRLRQVALARHRAATRKISRIKSANGVEVSGSDYDPRKSPEFIRGASASQLQGLIRKLDAFNSRGVQFVPDSQFRPIRRDLFEEYQRAEAKRNQVRDENYSEFKNIPIKPAGGVTVDDRLRQITPLHAHMTDMSTDNPYKRSKLSSTSVASESKLKDLTKHRRKQATKSHQRQVLKAHRDAVMDMAVMIGDHALQEGLAALTNKQFALIWRYTVFATFMKSTYNFYKDSISGRKGVTNSQMAENDMQQARDYVDWAKTVKFS